MNNIYEKPQDQNPNRFSIKQHFIPKESIKRFCNKDNKVMLKNLISKKGNKSQVSPTDEIFIVKRLWNQEAEEGFSKSIEDKFQNLVDKIIKTDLHVFNQDENMNISRMYALWEARIDCIEHFKELEEKIYIPIDSKGDKLSQSEREQLEKKNCSYVYAENGLPTRDYFNLKIKLSLQRKKEEYKDISWRVLFTESSGFIMPSNPIYKTFEILFPISPNICLVPNCIYEVIAKEDVEYFNQLMIDNAKWFYFGKVGYLK